MDSVGAVQSLEKAEDNVLESLDVAATLFDTLAHGADADGAATDEDLAALVASFVDKVNEARAITLAAIPSTNEFCALHNDAHMARAHLHQMELHVAALRAKVAAMRAQLGPGEHAQ